MKKILFITGTRADFGKIKGLIQAVEESEKFSAYVYVTGMHLLEKYGGTYKEVLDCGFKNIYLGYGSEPQESMSRNVASVINSLTGYVLGIRPDMIVVHGDRTDALAGAVVGALNNIIVAHIEGGELSGTIDESLRHCISKLSNIHFACNEEAKKRLVQLGEKKKNIFVIGSPDIDIMNSRNLPDIKEVYRRYGLNYEKYSILMYHPVTTETDSLYIKVREVVDAVIESGKNYVVIYPNNDLGSETILNEYKRFKENSKISVFPSMRFEHFLVLLKNAEFMLGNSSAGIRETGFFAVPAIDIGTRQNGRYSLEKSTNIQHVNENCEEILNAIENISGYKIRTSDFGEGRSIQKFMDAINTDLWEIGNQKQFVDIDF